MTAWDLIERYQAEHYALPPPGTEYVEMDAHNRAWRGAQASSTAKQVQSSVSQSESDFRGVGDDLHNAELMRKSLHNAAVNQERQEALRRSRRGKDGVK